MAGNDKRPRHPLLPVGIGACIAIGVAIGMAMDNIGAGIAIGVALGVAFGAGGGHISRDKDQDGRQ